MLVCHLCTWIQFGGQRIVQVERRAIELISLAQHVRHTAFGYLVAQSGEELQTLAWRGEAHRLLHLLRLRFRNEPFHPLIDQGKVLVVSVWRLLLVTVLLHEPTDYYLFKSCF